MRAAIKDFIVTENGKQLLTLDLQEDFRLAYDELHDKDVELDIGVFRARRSKDSNAYMWELCGKIAEKTGESKEDVYRKNVKEGNVYHDWWMTEADYKTFKTSWEMHGIAWFCEDVDASGRLIHFRSYFGSSVYNTRQMSALLDRVIQDAQAQDIDTRTPDEIANMMSLYEQERNEKEN